MASKRAATAYSIILLLGTAVLFVSSGGLGAIKAYLTMAITPLIRDETDRQASEITGELKKLELRVADLEQAQKLDQVEALAGSLRALEQRVSGTERSINILGDEVFSHDPSVSESVAVSTIGPGYSIARTPHGVFLISASVVSPYLDGYKIRLKVGNMLSATMKGAKLPIK